MEETKQLTKEFIYHNWKRLFLLTIMLVGTAFFEIVPVVVYMFFGILLEWGINLWIYFRCYLREDKC